MIPWGIPTMDFGVHFQRVVTFATGGFPSACGSAEGAQPPTITESTPDNMAISREFDFMVFPGVRFVAFIQI